MVNASGSDKPKLCIIGNAEKPRCFTKSFHPNSIVDYYSNKSAWMTSEIFEKLIKKFNSRLRSENRKQFYL